MGNEEIGWCEMHQETNDPCYGCKEGQPPVAVRNTEGGLVHTCAERHPDDCGLSTVVDGLRFFCNRPESHRKDGGEHCKHRCRAFQKLLGKLEPIPQPNLRIHVCDQRDLARDCGYHADIDDIRYFCLMTKHHGGDCGHHCKTIQKNLGPLRSYATPPRSEGTALEEYVLRLNRYQRDNLLWLMSVIGHGGKPIAPFDEADNGDWVGEIANMLSPDGLLHVERGDKPNVSREDLEKQVRRWTEGVVKASVKRWLNEWIERKAM